MVAGTKVMAQFNAGYTFTVMNPPVDGQDAFDLVANGAKSNIGITPFFDKDVLYD